MLLSKSRYFIFIFFIILLVLLGIWFLVGRLALFQSSSYISLFSLDTSRELYQKNILWLGEEVEIKQDFVATYPGLYQVSIFLTRAAEENQDVTMRFYLKNTCTSLDDLRQIVVTVSKDDVAQDMFYPFTFEPIDESAGHHYCLVLETIGALSEENIGVWASWLDVYEEGEAIYLSPPEPEQSVPEVSSEVSVHQSPSNLTHKVYLPTIFVGKSKVVSENFDVGFQLHYRGHPIDSVRVFATRLVNYKPYFWGDVRFYSFLLVIYAILLFLLVRVKAD